MAFTEKISLVIDVATNNFTSGMRQLRRDVEDADGVIGKAKAGAGGLVDVLKANMATAAVAAGTALVGFGVKSVEAFQNTALGAGKLRDALGVTAEEASRLQEVAGDLGIGVDALQSTIGRMNRAAADTPAKFAAIGAAIQRNRDGTVNVTETFLSVVDALHRIPDATKRAAAAQEIFGRGWQSIAELVAQGADGVRESLASVESQKVVNDKQIGDARKLRDNMDQLKGTTEAFAIAVGEVLVPALNDGAGALLSFAGPLKTVYDRYKDITSLPVVKQIYENIAPWEQWQTRVRQVGDALDWVRGNSDDLHGSLAPTAGLVDTSGAAAAGAARDFELFGVKLFDAKALAERMAERTDRLKDALDKSRDAASRSADAFQRWRDRVFDAAGGAHDLEQSNLDLESAVLRSRDASKALADASGDELAPAMIAARDAQLGAADQAWNAAEAFAQSKGAAEGSAQKADLMKQRLRELQDRFPELRAEIQAYIDKLNAIPASKTTNIVVRQSTVTASGAPARNFVKPSELAAGGVAREGDIAGEDGAEHIRTRDGRTAIIDEPTVMPEGAVVTPLKGGASAGSGSGGVGGAAAVVFSPTINITAGVGADPHAIQRVFMDALNGWVANNGAAGIRRLIGLPSIAS